MLGSTAALTIFNVVWPSSRRAAASGTADRYDYRPAPPAAGNSAVDASVRSEVQQDPPPGHALRPPPPAWRACRADMPRMAFLCLVCGWAGAVLALLATVLLIRFAG
jgi:hypothetical protein